VKCVVKEPALQEGRFELEEFSALWPNGEFIAYPGNAALPAASFEGRLERAGEKLPVHLVLALVDPESPGTTESGEEQWGKSRYRVHREEVNDLNKGKDSQLLEFREYELRVVFGEDDDLPERCDHIKIAEIERGAEQSRPYLVTKNYAPPCVKLAASRILLQTVRTVTHGINVKLQDLHKDKEVILGKDAPGDLKKALLMQALHTYQPLLMSEIEAGDCHPFRAFNLLSALAGALAAIHSDRDPSKRFEYDHRDPLQSLAPLCDQINTDVDREGPRAIKELPSRREGDYFHSEVPLNLLENSRVYLKIRTTKALDALYDQMKGSMKVGCRTMIENMVSKFLPGAGLEKDAFPPAYPLQSDEMFFRIDREGKEWSGIEREGNISVYLPSDDPELSVSIVVERQEGADR
jgi:type VI secretion system ImpJ/VasE family protein